MDSNHQNTEGLSPDLLALVTWVQAMPRSKFSIPKTDDVEQSKIVAELNFLKKLVAQLIAQFKDALVEYVQAVPIVIS